MWISACLSIGFVNSIFIAPVKLPANLRLPCFLIAIDTRSGLEMWRVKIGNHEWSSPALIEQKLLVGLCEAGGLVAYDLKDPKNPSPMWTVKVGGCSESSPTVWKGRFYVGSRDGYIYGFGE